MKRTVVVAMLGGVLLAGGGAMFSPAIAQDAKPVEKGVKASNLVSSLGPFREVVSIPLVFSGQTIEIEAGGQTGRQRHLVPTYVYVLEGTLVTNTEGGRVGVAGVQYHTAGQSYSDPVGVWHNYSNPGPGPLKYLLLYVSTPGQQPLTEKAKADD